MDGLDCTAFGLNDFCFFEIYVFVICIYIYVYILLFSFASFVQFFDLLSEFESKSASLFNN
jgi:hypothetical protein